MNWERGEKKKKNKTSDQVFLLHHVLVGKIALSLLL